VIQLLMPVSARSVINLRDLISVSLCAFFQVGLRLRVCCQGKSSHAYLH